MRQDVEEEEEGRRKTDRDGRTGWWWDNWDHGRRDEKAGGSSRRDRTEPLISGTGQGLGRQAGRQAAWA